MLELARLLVNSGWVPPRPIIFLFNGAEELFMLGAHGFMTTSKWRDFIGAVINVEASGTGGPDLVCQSGPGSWPSRVYAESAVYPMAHSAAQDVFPVIPGDTDYRIFSQDYGNVPGLDIIFLLGGYFYHTSYDTVDRLLPGSIQARGENLFSLLKAFTNSSSLKTAYERESIAATAGKHEDDRAVFFDYLSWILIFYPRSVADLLHCVPIAIFLLMPLILSLSNSGSRSCFAISLDFMKGIILHAVGIILAVLCPVFFSILRLLFSSHAMNWFAHPFLAFAMFVPCSLLGLLIPRMIWRQFPLSQDNSVAKISKEVLADESRFWGAFGCYAILTLAYFCAGLSGGFLTFSLSASMLLAWISFCLVVKSSCCQSLRSTIIYVIPLLPCLTYAVYFGGLLIQFLIEKMGMMGSVPSPYGFFIPDIIVSAVIGVATGWCMGPLIPIYGCWLAKSSILKLLLHLTVIAMALSSQFFPYSKDAPKRVVLQNTYLTHGSNRVVEARYDFSVVDSNALPYLFKYAPEVARELDVGSDFSLEAADPSPRQTFMALFPVSFMFSGSLKFSARSDEIMKHYQHLPHLSASKPQAIGKESRRVYVELSLGSLEEVWVAVLNVTGPLSGWSFADQALPVPETADGGPPSYICRLSGSSSENWTFWLEASSLEDLRVDVAVLDQYMVGAAKKLKGLFPDWVDVTAYSSFMSSYTF
ncbi:endoplasmic reticulum metallopeptidase 1 isoform X2 [Punica granatum]|nr:endoplasmic reticulum metallopeptidase 1 isoform X2 [Punica granatum]